MANYSDRTLSVLDTRTHTVIATIDVGANPWGVAVDPDADTVYVTNSGDGTVSVVDTRTRTVTDTVNVGDRIFAVAVDPTAPAAYITNRNDSVSVVEPIR